jgi:hypothetical protein
VILVTLPEETPVNELVDTAYAIEDRAGVGLGPIVVNGCVEAISGLDRDGLHGVAGIRADAARAGADMNDGEIAALAAAAEYRVELQARQAHQCDRLAQRLPLPQLRLPFLLTADIGPIEIERLADALTAGVHALDDVSAR